MRMSRGVVLLLILLAGCGGGGGGGGGTPEPERGEATNANAFQAYNVMSVTAYLPAFIPVAHRSYGYDFEKEPGSVTKRCNGGGTVRIEYGNVTNEVRYGNGLLERHRYDDCIFDYKGFEIAMDGELMLYFFLYPSDDGEREQLYYYGAVVEGFDFSIKGNGMDIALHYLANPKIDVKKAKELYGRSDISIFLNYRHQERENTDSYEYIVATNTAYAGKWGKHLQFDGAFTRENDFFSALPDRLVQYLTIEDSTDWINSRYPVVSEDRDTIYVRFSDGEYFRMHDTFANMDPFTPLVFTDAKGNSVKVWQDVDETVFAEDRTGQEMSLTTYTPAF